MLVRWFIFMFLMLTMPCPDILFALNCEDDLPTSFHKKYLLPLHQDFQFQSRVLSIFTIIAWENAGRCWYGAWVFKSLPQLSLFYVNVYTPIWNVNLLPSQRDSLASDHILKSTSVRKFSTGANFQDSYISP